MFGNGFIAVIYCIDWIKRGKQPPCDMILTCLCMSQILLQGAFIACLLINTFAPWIYIVHDLELTIGFLGLFAGTADLWIAACLSIVYCVKITSCKQPFFLQMKQRISAMVCKMLLCSLLVSSVSSLPYIWGEYNLYFCISAGDLFRNSTVATSSWDVSCFYYLLVYSASSFFPFILFLTTSILLISSLCRHTRKMQNNQFLDLSTKAHVRAIKAMSSCLALHVCNFVALTTLTLPSSPAIACVVIAAYPSGYSLILIAIHPKLRQALVRILYSIKCHVKEDIF